jgi:predicted nucleotidyltransferase component of viral defense system
LLEVQEHFGLPSPALVEKDWYVVKALAAIGQTETAPFRLVFDGGTALSRAHRLIRRMSEDIDLKIVCDSEFTRPALRNLRDAITSALLESGFSVRPDKSRASRIWQCKPLDVVSVALLSCCRRPREFTSRDSD